MLLVAGGIAFGYLVAQGTTSGILPDDSEAAEAMAAASEAASAIGASDPSTDEALSFPGTILASVEFGLVWWHGPGTEIRSTSG